MVENLLYILPRGLAIGALISAPMGPIGMLIIQRTLSKGRWSAFFTGIGAAISDLLYCLLAGFGISFITDIIERHQFALQVFGSIVLAIFGFILFRKNPTRSLKTAEVDNRSYWGEFISGFFLTFSNPLILFFIIGLFARFNFILPEYIILHYIWAYLTIFGGAIIWWYQQVALTLQRQIPATCQPYRRLDPYSDGCGRRCAGHCGSSAKIRRCLKTV